MDSLQESNTDDLLYFLYHSFSVPRIRFKALASREPGYLPIQFLPDALRCFTAAGLLSSHSIEGACHNIGIVVSTGMGYWYLNRDGETKSLPCVVVPACAGQFRCKLSKAAARRLNVTHDRQEVPTEDHSHQGEVCEVTHVWFMSTTAGAWQAIYRLDLAKIKTWVSSIISYHLSGFLLTILLPNFSLSF